MLYEVASGYPFLQMKLDELKAKDQHTNQLKFYFFAKDPIISRDRPDSPTKQIDMEEVQKEKDPSF